VLHGEFMEYEEGVRHILELTDIEAWRSKVVPFKPGPVRIGCDFAAGGDSNVILAGIGNYLKEIVPWKDRNTATATGRFTDELKRIIKRERANRPNIGVGIYGDATGIGRTMVDTIRENGISIVAFNFGAKIKNPVYKDLGTFAWYTAAKRIKDGEIRVANWNHPTVKALIAQLSSRRQKRHSSGCLWMEQKHEMAARGVRSPDIADAFVQVFGIQSPRSFPWGPNDDDSEWTEIAKKHGWEYTSGERAAYFNPLAPENREPSSIGYGDDGHLVHDCWSRGA